MIYKEVPMQIPGSEPYARLQLYLQSYSEEIPYSEARKLILICPGGGYHLTTDREAEAVALQFMAMGYHAAVLRYSVAPARFPTALLELGRAVLFLKEHAEEWHIDREGIVVSGFSAGGHLAASYGVFYPRDFVLEALDTTKDELRPAGLLLCYPVISAREDICHPGSFLQLLGEASENQEKRRLVSLEEQVTAETPKTFLWHTWEDDTVPVENSLVFAGALRKHRVPTELHIFEKGGHGLSLANELTDNADGVCRQKECEIWVELAKAWLKNL